MTRRRVRADDPAGATIDWRPTDDGVELYDGTNPDAWIRVAFDAGVPPEQRLFMICPDCGAIAPHRSKPGDGSVCGECESAFDHER